MPHLNKSLLARAMALIVEAQGHAGPTERIPGRIELKAQGSDAADLYIFGDIGESWWGESITAMSVVEQLNALEPAVKTINVYINSYGGSVVDGLAIYNALKRKAKSGATINTAVDGIAASIASLILMAGSKRSMAANTRLMVHAPWGGLYVTGNANEVEEAAESFVAVLKGYADSMAHSYSAATGKPHADMLALMQDGKDHWYSASEAKAEGFVTEVVEDAETEQTAAQALATIAAQPAFARYFERMPTQLAASLRRPIPATAAESNPQASARANPPASAGPTTGVIPMPESQQQQADTPKPADTPQAALAALRERNTEIRALAGLSPDNPDVLAYVNRVIDEADPAISAGDVGKEILRLQAKGRQPLNGGGHVVAGHDQRDKLREAGAQMILARAGALKPDEDAKARNGNPFNGLTLMDMARECAAAAGVNTRGMDTERVFQAAVTQTTSDFPVMFENALHKILIQQFLAGEQAWRRFCKIGTLSDFRPHIRIFGSTFSDLEVVNEAGEYKDGNYPDGEKQTLTARSKGRILNLSYEATKNDDIGFFSDAAQGMGSAAIRTLNKDVFALFALNGGAGPTMTDGQPLFHSSHNNIAGTAAVPTVTSVDAARQQMAKQKAPGGNDDYLDLRPAVWLGPLSLSGAARVVNGDTYDPDAANKLQRTNIAKGTYSDIVDSPRLGDTAWYSFADPNQVPVIEVGFVDGIQVPRLVMQEAFRSNGVSWRVTYDYAVGAVGFRGALKTPAPGG